MAGRLVIFLTVISFLGCVAAIPAIVYYSEKHKGYAVTVQLDVEANKVYQTAVDLIEDPPRTEILPKFKKVTNIKKDDEKMAVTFDVVFEDGTHHDKVKVTAIGAKRSQLIAISDISAKKDEDKSSTKQAEKTSALRIVKVICDRLGVKYTVVKG